MRSLFQRKPENADSGGKMRFLGHNFGSRHARRSSKASIDAGDHLVFKKRLSQNFGPLNWRPEPVKVGQKKRITPICEPLPGEPLTQIQNVFYNRTKKSCRIRRGFEQLSSYSDWRVITKKLEPIYWLARSLEGCQTALFVYPLRHLCNATRGNSLSDAHQVFGIDTKLSFIVRQHQRRSLSVMKRSAIMKLRSNHERTGGVVRYHFY